MAENELPLEYFQGQLRAIDESPTRTRILQKLHQYGVENEKQLLLLVIDFVDTEDKANYFVNTFNLLTIEAKVLANSLIPPVQAFVRIVSEITKVVLVAFYPYQTPTETIRWIIQDKKYVKKEVDLGLYFLSHEDGTIVSPSAPITFGETLTYQKISKIEPTSASNWTDDELEQLKVTITEATDMMTFFTDAGATIDEDTFTLSDKGNHLLELFNNMETNIAMYKRMQPPHSLTSSEANLLRFDPQMQHPIFKLLLLASNNSCYESYVDSFVMFLLHEMGFNDGSLCVAPQYSLQLHYRDRVTDATSDFAIIDLLSNAKIAVTKDKNSHVREDPYPQLVAEGIAIAQIKLVKAAGKKRDSGREVPIPTEKVYGITVSGSKFRFYVVEYNQYIHTSMTQQTPTTSYTPLIRYSSADGLNFMVREQRAEIVRMLSALQKIMMKTTQNYPPPPP